MRDVGTERDAATASRRRGESPACPHALLLVVMLAVGGFAPVHARNADSLAYAQKRDAIAASGAPTGVVAQNLEAADALAAEGLYREAVDMLDEATRASPPQTAAEPESAQATGAPPAPPASPPAAPAIWRIGAGADYYQLDDVDTAAFSQEQKDSLRRLQETPLSAYVRGALDWRPGGVLSLVSPAVQLSNRKARLEATVAARMAGGLVVLAGTAEGEKPFWSDYSDTAAFTGGRADSSDMGGLRVTCEATSRPLERPVSGSLPASFQWRHYRNDRNGYVSYRQFGASPTVEARTRDGTRSVSLSWPVSYRDYYATAVSDGHAYNADSLDVLRTCPTVSLDLWQGGVSAAVDAGWYLDLYQHRGNPRRSQVVEVAQRLSATATPWLRPRMQSRYTIERESHDYLDLLLTYPDTAPLVYELSGTRSLLAPSLEFTLPWSMQAVLGFSFDRKEAAVVQVWEIVIPAARAKALWETSRAYEPNASLALNAGPFDGRVGGAFRYEDTDTNVVFTTGDSRTWKVGAEADWQVVRWLSVFVSTDYQRTLYEPYTPTSRSSQNLSLSCSLSARF